MSEQNKFSKELFKNPTKEYRGAPFWAWNGKLSKPVIKEQVENFKKMGFGGFHIHSRIGLSTPYLSDEFMDCVKYCNACAKENEMLTYLYDEDKWPSGYGGGRVTQNEDFRARYLLVTQNFYENGYLNRNLPAKGRLTENGFVTLLSRFDVELSDGKIVSYKLLDKNEESHHALWYAYEVVGEKLPWFNNEAYVDVLNPEAIEKFLELTHETYKKHLGNDFGKNIPSIFTDEPQFIKMQQLEEAECGEADLAYTKDMEKLFEDMYGYNFMEKLPELLWDRADGVLPLVRYHYYNFLSERFSKSYAKTIGKWCDENNIKLTGHLMQEDTLESQSQCVGDAMRSYPYFGIPGIDLLAGIPEYNAAKQVQSVVHQYGKTDAISELYGVTNWDYDFRHHKLQGDWHAALGITLRVPHLAWMYMGGESKRDYPAPIDAHSTWYEKYPLIENHFARVNTVLKRGKADVKVAVLHPVESYWMLIASKKQTMQKRNEMNKAFAELTEMLIFNLIDFDFISEGLMPSQNVKVQNGKLSVGEMEYEVIVIPKLLTIRQSTIDILEKFQSSGGKIVWLSDMPDYVDGAYLKKTNKLNIKPVGFDKENILKELEPYRDIDATDSLGIRHNSLIYQMREENGEKWLFIAHGKEEDNIEFGVFAKRATEILDFSVKGLYEVELLDTLSGEICKVDAKHKNGNTLFELPCFEHDSLLFHLTAKSDAPLYNGEEKEISQEFYLNSVCDYSLDEPNTLLLDQACWSLDDEDFRQEEEILKIDDMVREKLSMRKRTDSFPQPWLSKGDNKKEHTLNLKFEFESETDISDVSLAFEGETDVEVIFNGNNIKWDKGEFFVDRMINKISVPDIKKGENELILKIPFNENTNPEWCYILGNFGVRTVGRKAVITKMPEKIGFGDITTQGFSFYGGSLVYETSFESVDGFAEIEISNYIAPLLCVSIDDGKEIPLFIAPYKVDLGKVLKGKHTIKIRSYGSRINQFGQVHNCNPRERYFGPRTWRTDGNKWCYEYNLKKCGVLTAPIVRIYKNLSL